MTKPVGKQQIVIDMLNRNMILGHQYPYQILQGRAKELKIKEGTLTSVLTQAKNIGAIMHDEGTSERERVRVIYYDEMNEYSKAHYVTQTNNEHVSQKICDKVKALKTVNIDHKTMSTVLFLKEDIIDDIVNCHYNIREYNTLYRSRQEEPVIEVPLKSDNGSMESQTTIEALTNLRTAINNTIRALQLEEVKSLLDSNVSK